MRLPLVTVLLTAATFLQAPGPAATQVPNLAGAWELDSFMGRAPLGFRNERAICELPAAPRPAAEFLEDAADSMTGDADGLEQMTPFGTFEAELTIAQSATDITIDRQYGGSLGKSRYKDVFKLDGSENVLTAGQITSRTRSRWEGETLVVDHSLSWGKAPNDGACRVRETFTLDAGGTLHVVATNEAADRVMTSRQQFRKKRRPVY